jgi:hypothetical protein
MCEHAHKLKSCELGGNLELFIFVEKTSGMIAEEVEKQHEAIVSDNPESPTLSTENMTVDAKETGISISIEI